MPNVNVMGTKGTTGPILRGSLPDCSRLPTNATDGDVYVVAGRTYLFMNQGWSEISGPVGPKGNVGPMGPPPFHTVFMTFPNGKFCMVDLEEEMLDSFVYPMFPTVDEVALFSMNYPRKAEKLVALCPTDRAFETPISQDFIKLRVNNLTSLTENTVALFAQGMLAKEHSDFFHDAANPTVQEWEMLLFAYPDLKDICYKAAQAAGQRNYNDWQKFISMTGREVRFNVATKRNEAINQAKED